MPLNRDARLNKNKTVKAEYGFTLQSMKKILWNKIPTNASVFYFTPQVTLTAIKGPFRTKKHIKLWIVYIKSTMSRKKISLK